MERVINTFDQVLKFMLRAGGRSLWLVTWMSFGLIGLSASAQQQQPLFYRYVNDDGIKVLEQSIPPEYAQRGYEVVNVNGDVVRIVKASLTEEELAARDRQRKLEEWDKALLTRYSTVSDVRAAKKRRLGEINTYIAILRGNILNLDSQIAREQSKAADSERAGLDVPEVILINIQNFRNEKRSAEEQIDLRREEYESVAEQFDRDIARFEDILQRREQAQRN
ncbi:hypothetical protein [Sessilibacter sp. MAH2]